VKAMTLEALTVSVGDNSSLVCGGGGAGAAGRTRINTSPGGANP